MNHEHFDLLARGVRSREQLADFILSLLADLRADPESWENATLENFLEAMSGWVQDMHGYYQNIDQPLPEPPSWSTFADILLASTQYE